MSKPERNWLPANPWFWAGIGLALAATACAGGFILWEVALPPRFFLSALGILSSGVALIIRLGSAGPAAWSRLSPTNNKWILFGLLVLYALTAAGITGLVLLAVISFITEPNPTIKFGISAILWFLLVPMSVQAAQNVWRRLARQEEPTEREEASALLLVFGLTAYVSCWALYVPDDPQQWDSMRLLFAALAFVAVAAAPLPVLSQVWRRTVISVVIVLHFGGICTAVLAAPPAPPILFQLWMRIYRPYLEFMYLNNAYHFYAPEPGPASYLWFRAFYEDPKNGDLYPLWLKLPDHDDKTGQFRYPLALNYQRFLAMIENTAAPPVPVSLMEADGITWTENMRRRAINTPQGAKELAKQQKEEILGQRKIDIKPGDLLIPLHRSLALGLQYQVPQAHVQALIESFAKHVAEWPYPGHPEYKFKSLKVYRVRHEIPPQPIGPNTNHLEPRDPEGFRPFYLGEFDRDGKLTKDQDPFLYWALPIQKESPDGMVRDWARRHAGDTRWAWNENRREWIEGPDPDKQ